MSSFHERQKTLFNHLKEAEEQCGYSTQSNNAHNVLGSGEIDKYTYRKLRHEMKQFRGRESIFKRTEANIRECLRAKTIPDHIKNPQRYTYYTLADVTQEQMSDATNTATALALIRKMEDQELKIEFEEDIDDSGGVFKKPVFCSSASVKKENINDHKVTFKSSKVIMPEYVVGAKQNKVKKERKVRNSTDDVNVDKKVDLTHLYEDE